MYSEEIFINDCIEWLKTVYDEDYDYEELIPYISNYIINYCNQMDNEDYKEIIKIYKREETNEEITDILENKLSSKILYGFVYMDYSTTDTCVHDELEE